MPEIQQNHSNADSISPNLPVDNIQEGMLKMKVEEKKEEGEGVVVVEYPGRPGEPDCQYYMKFGRCGYGDTCCYNHPPLPVQTEQSKIELPQREGKADCGHFLRTGSCKYGSVCKYHHPLDRRVDQEVPLNSLGLPLRKEKPCAFYLRTQKCKFGPACKFDHPPPSSVEAASPVPGATAVGVCPSLSATGYPYYGAVPTLPWTRSSHFPAQQAYMPYYIPPQNWNGHLGNMSSWPASSLMGTDFAHNSKNLGALASGQADLLTMASSYPPERPDEPECRFFMSTGGCKYGSTCKFHHPKDRIAHSLGPHGLPLRPGVDLCGHFSSYGICKYGPTCKFNHPITGYFPGFFFNLPLNQPFFPHQQRNLPVSNSNGRPHSKSSNITDWIQKPETVAVKNPEGKNSEQHLVTKATEASPEGSPPQPSPESSPPQGSPDKSSVVSVATSEIPRDQSD